MGVDAMRRLGVIVALTALLACSEGGDGLPGPRQERDDGFQFFPFGFGTATGICRPVDRRVTQRQMLHRMVPEQAAASPMFTELIAASDVIIGETLMAKGLGG